MNETIKITEEMKTFYKIMDYKIFNIILPGANTLINISSNIHADLSGTLDSIDSLIKRGNVTDAYVLLRKVYDLVCFDLYINLYSRKEINIDNMFNNSIFKWIKGEDSTKGFKYANNYIINNYSYNEIKNFFYPKGDYQNSIFKDIRERCNYAVHFGSISYFLSKDKQKIINVEKFHQDLRYIFVYHLTILITTVESYFASDDYINYLDMGMTPIEGSQYWVTEYMQEILDNYIRKENVELYDHVKEIVSLDLK